MNVLIIIAKGKQVFRILKSDDFLAYNGNLIIKLINKILYIEEILPFLNFKQQLNKQQIVTQNLKKNPSILNMNILSILNEPKLDGIL